MNRIITKLSILLVFTLLPFVMVAQSNNKWQAPPEDLLEVLNAPQLPWVYTSPTGEYLLLLDPMLFPSLADLAAPMHKLAGSRVNPAINGYHGRYGGTSPRLVRIHDGKTTALDMPADSEILSVRWTVDGQHFALSVKYPDHIGLWVGSVNGVMKRMEDIALNPLMGTAVSWLPDQERLLIKRIPLRGAAPVPPSIPIGPKILEGEGASARSTYEARNLLKTAHDDALFEYHTKSELVILGLKRKI